MTGGNGEVQYLEFGVRLDLFSPTWVYCSLLGSNYCTVSLFIVEEVSFVFQILNLCLIKNRIMVVASNINIKSFLKNMGILISFLILWCVGGVR